MFLWSLEIKWKTEIHYVNNLYSFSFQDKEKYL